MNPVLGLALIVIIAGWPILYCSLWLAQRLDEDEEEA